MSAAGSILGFIVGLCFVFLIYYALTAGPAYIVHVGGYAFSIGGGGFSIPGLKNLTGIGAINLSYPTTSITVAQLPQNETYAYVLSLINNDRNTFGLGNVSYSNITSAQQHASNMLQYGYLSHWDVYGMKPYMRYTLLGGKGAVEENVAYTYNSSGVNVLADLKQMEYSMMYNDEQCCNNGHRNNILDQYHNQVSIGVAYNATTIYLVEDFIDNYVSWFYGTPSYQNGIVNLQGTAGGSYSLAEVEISYDALATPMTVGQLKNTSEYSYGTTIAAIGYRRGNEIIYFPSLRTINATTYTTQGGNFDVAFNMSGLQNQYGAGEYTVMVWLQNSTTQNASFVGSAYTIFINQSGQQYVPPSV
jgi:uncharacterized protein YkwD